MSNICKKCINCLLTSFEDLKINFSRHFQITTDLYHQCTEEFKGTSASAPLAAGIMALALEAKYVNKKPMLGHFKIVHS